MEAEGFLQTIAEISAAIAGFSGLIVALRKTPGPLTVVQKYRLRVLLLLAFGALFLSLVPSLLGFFGVEAAAAWKLCSMMLCMYSIVFVGWWTTASLKIRRTEPQIFSRFAFLRMAGGHVLIILVQAAFLASVLDSGVFAFTTGLVWYLLHSAQQFTRMLFVSARSDAPA